jgi:hypothetical protein
MQSASHLELTRRLSEPGMQHLSRLGEGPEARTLPPATQNSTYPPTYSFRLTPLTL